MNVTVRGITIADAAAVCAIYNPYVLETVITFEQTPVAETEMAVRIRDLVWLSMGRFSQQDVVTNLESPRLDQPVVPSQNA